MRTALLILGLAAMADAVDDKEPTYRATVVVDNI